MNLHSANKHRSSHFIFGSQGFTLLEVIISLAVMVFISMGIYTATMETYRLRDTLSTEGDFYNGIRLSMSILQADIASLYSPLMGIPSKNNVQNSNTPPDLQEMAMLTVDDLARPFTFWAPAVAATGVRPSRLIGSEEKISFVSASHIRIYKESQESDLAKITYELKPEESGSDGPGGSILVKTESANAFASDDVKDTMIKSYPILHGVKKLSILYYQRDGNTWKTFKSWDSTNADTKNKYPAIVEFNIEVAGKKSLNFVGKFKFRPEIPLNGLNASS